MFTARFGTMRVALATLFGVLIFVSKIVLPSPIDKMFIAVQALLLALASLILGKMGATYTAAVGGLLTTIWRIEFLSFTLLFAVVYGLMVDGSFYILKVRTQNGKGKTKRLVAALTLSTAATGLLSTYVTVTVGLLPWIPTLYFAIIAAGVVNGLIAGYLALLIWKKWLTDYAK